MIAAASIIPAFLNAGQEYIKQVVDQRPGIGWTFVVFQGPEWLFLGALTPLTYYAARRFPIRRGGLAAASAHLIGMVVFCLAWAGLGIAVGRPLKAWMAEGDLSQAYFNWTLTMLPWAVLMYLMILACLYGLAYFREVHERQAREAWLSAQLSEAKLESLRMQLRPHFLFNSLNAATQLVHERQSARAARVLELLADLLRQVLRPTGQLVPLDQELRFVEQYLDIEQERFSDRLRVSWTIDDNNVRKAMVPSFVLQPLVENAIRHGIARGPDAGRIEIAAHSASDELTVTVSDDGPGFTLPLAAAQGVGLHNTRERLRTLYGDTATLTLSNREPSGAIATLTLPYSTDDARSDR
jgi:two-component system, LytTR family, sensor kinase